MSKIPSMKSYVISESTKLYRNIDRNEETYSEHAEKLLKHANLLERPIHIRYYVPTFTNGQVFSKFQISCLSEKEPPANLVKAFGDAAREIIFPGWEVKEETDNHVKIGMIDQYFNLTWNKRINQFDEYIRIIDDMVPFELETNLTFD